MKKIVELFDAQRNFFNEQKTKNIDFRIKHLKHLKNAIIKNYENIKSAFKADMNKSEGEVYFCEYMMVINEINLIIKKLKKWLKPISVKRSLTTIFSKSKIFKFPYGNVLIISPWNYPFQLSFIPLVDAIAAGNTSIIYLNRLTLKINTIISKIILSVFPKEYVTTITYEDVPHEELFLVDYNYVFFTGSEKIGKIINKQASEKLIPTTLELGGKCPVLVLDDANIDTAAKRIIRGKLLNNGQTCVAPDYVFVNNKIKNKLVGKLIFYTKKFESNVEERTHIISQTHFERLDNLLSEQNFLLKGEKEKNKLAMSLSIIECDLKNKIMSEEIFGPILPIITFNDIKDVITNLTNSSFPLALYIFTKNKDFFNKLLSKIKCGGACMNNTVLHISNPNLPFGGFGNSGMGKYHGKFGVDTFSHDTAVLYSTNMDSMLMYPPYNKKTKLFKKILKQ